MARCYTSGDVRIPTLNEAVLSKDGQCTSSFQKFTLAAKLRIELKQMVARL